MITYRLETTLGPLRALTDGLFRPGRPVVLLHGWTLSPWAWGALMPTRLRAQRRWYALSLPGHLPEANGQALAALTTERLAEALAQALEDLVGDEPVHLVGHSMGGFWGLCLAVHQPERLSRLVLLSSFADGGQVSLLQTTRRLAAYEVGRWLFRSGYRWVVARPGRFRRLLARLSGRPGVWEEAAGQVFFDSVYPDAKRYRPEALLQLARDVAHLDLTGHMTAVPCPVLVVTGAKDPVVSVTHAREMAERLSQAYLHVLTDVGHFPMVEVPETVFALMEKFLATESPSRV